MMRIFCLCSFLSGLLGSMTVVRDLSERLALESGLFFGGNISKFTFFGEIARPTKEMWVCGKWE